MRGRVAIAAAVLVVAGAGIVVLVTSAGSEDRSAVEPAGSPLAWDEPPLAISPKELPDDRVAYGTVRNASFDQLDAATADFVVRDAEGRELDASVQFLGTYAHGVYGAFTKPDPLPEEELARLGYTIDLGAGETSPLTVSYRLARDSVLPATLYYKGLPALDLPMDG